ncbi:MAG: CotH kinase family protein [Oscillospiraceae bacterium]|nr:CotH kinase family protein [Oscillospiraceae bacterium]
MKRGLRALSACLAAVLVIALIPGAPSAFAADAPSEIWVEPTDANGLPAGIDVFESRVQTGGNYWNPTYTYYYQLYLPGGVDTASCFFSWDDDMQATVDGVSYPAGACPVPPAGTSKTYAFQNGSSIDITTYQGSGNVQRVFIDIDESRGSIAAMDGDTSHNTQCYGRININGTWYENIKMKGRGNVTWSQASDKRPYNITLDSKIKFPGIDSEKSKKWSFLAEILDHSLLCNRSGFRLAHELGVGQDTTSADVWMNGEYQGCYTVTPKTDSFVTKNGFMIEQDNYQEPSVAQGGDPQFSLEGLNGASNDWSTSRYNLITVKKIGDNLLKNEAGEVDDSPENTEAVALNTIKPWLQDAWDAIRAADGYNSKGKYYTDYIDMESFAKMYLMHEYVKSYDVCAGSILYHRDGNTDADKLIAGPLWDLDNAMGATLQNTRLGLADNRRDGDRRSGEGDFIANITEYKTSVYKTLSRHEDFMAEVYRQYNLHRAAFDSIAGDTSRMISDISASATMNHIKVDELWNNDHKYSSPATLGSGVYTQNYLATTDSRTDWPNYAANLITFITTRSLWFANNYSDNSFMIGPDVSAHLVFADYAYAGSGNALLLIGVRGLGSGSAVFYDGSPAFFTEDQHYLDLLNSADGTYAGADGNGKKATQYERAYLYIIAGGQAAEETAAALSAGPGENISVRRDGNVNCGANGFINAGDFGLVDDFLAGRAVPGATVQMRLEADVSTSAYDENAFGSIDDIYEIIHTLAN